MELDGEINGGGTFETSNQDANESVRAEDAEKRVELSPEEDEEPKIWSLERNWGFSLDELFKLALKFFKEMNGKAFNPKYEENLRLVALHKQITLGPYNPQASPEIGFFDVLGNDRRKEWLRLGSMAKEDAMEDFVKLLNSCCILFAPYVTSHKIEKEEQDRRRKEEEEERLRLEREEQERQQLEEEARVRAEEEEEMRKGEAAQRKKHESQILQIEQQKLQIMAVLNAQTKVQFEEYARQHYPDSVEHQQLLIKQLQEQHFQQYVHQAIRLQQMALQKPQEDSDNIPKSDACPDSDESNGVTTNNSCRKLDNPEQKTDSKQFRLCVAKAGELPIVAPSMWTRPQIREFKEKVIHDGDSVVTVGRGEVLTVRVPTHQDGSHLFWEFATDHYDIGFGLFFEWKDLTIPVSSKVEEIGDIKEGHEEGEKPMENDQLPLVNEVVPVSRRDSYEEVYAGSHEYPGQGFYLLKFDNSYSLWRPKVVYYRVYYTK